MPPSLIATNYKANVSTGTCFIDVVRVKWLESPILPHLPTSHVQGWEQRTLTHNITTSMVALQWNL